MIYLDYSANTPVDEAVLQCFCEVERNCPGNANSRHAAGTAAKAAIDAATQSIARSLNVQPAEIIYTSGASEANNFAIKSIARLERHHGRHIISTPLEHSSVSGSLTALQEQGYEIDLVDIRQDGTVDLAHLKELLRPDTILVAVTAVDSELGVVQPVAEIAEMLKACPHCHFHVDATQAVGKLPVSFAGIDTMSLTAHKFYGLNGIGVLVKRRGLALEPLIHGGESTTLYRSGTPTVALACSLALALEKAVSELPARVEHIRALNARLRTGLAQYPKVRINSPDTAVPQILNLSVQNVKGTVFQRELDARGVCVSVKSACSSDGLPSRAVFAVSHDRRNALSSWRISLRDAQLNAHVEHIGQTTVVQDLHPHGVFQTVTDEILHVDNAAAGQVCQDHAECHGQQDQRLKLFDDGQVQQKTAHADHNCVQVAARLAKLRKAGALENTDQSINKLCHALPPLLKRCGGVVYTRIAPAVLAAAHSLEGVLAVAHCMDCCHNGGDHITGNALFHLRSGSSCGLLHGCSGLCSGSLGGFLGSLLLCVHRIEDLAFQRDNRHQQDKDQEHQYDAGNGNDHVKT